MTIVMTYSYNSGNSNRSLLLQIVLDIRKCEGGNCLCQLIPAT